jgi:hypothetical protein
MWPSFADRQLAVQYADERNGGTWIENLDGTEYVVVETPACPEGWPRNRVIRMDHDSVALWNFLTERENDIVDRWTWQIIVIVAIAFFAAALTGVISSSLAATSIMLVIVATPCLIVTFKKCNAAYRKIVKEKELLLARFGYPDIDPCNVGSRDEFLKKYVILPPDPSRPMSWP